MLITPSTTDIEDIIRNLLSWVPNSFKLNIVRNAIDEDIIDTLRKEIKEEVYDSIVEEVLGDYVHYTDVEYRAEELVEERIKEEKEKLETEAEYWQSMYREATEELNSLLNPKTDGN